MNIVRQIALAAMTLLFPLMINLHAAQVPAEDVAAKVKKLWSANNLADLRTYLSRLESQYPDFMPAVVASAFYDSIFCGKLNQAKDKLVRIQQTVNNSPGVFSEETQVDLSLSIQSENGAIEIGAENGQSESEWAAHANPQQIRDLWQKDYLPILNLLDSCPRISLTGKDPVPAAPTGLAATPGDTFVTLTWRGSDGSTSYRIYRGTNPSGENATAMKSGIGTTSFTDTSLDSGTTYFYKVKAINPSGISAESNEISATPLPAPSDP